MENEIIELIKSKRDSIGELEVLEKDREEHLIDAARKQIILRGLETADRANLWTDEGRKTIRKENYYLSKLLNIERYIRIELNKLNQIEYGFYSKLDSGEMIVSQDQKDILLRIMLNHAEVGGVHDLENMGVFQLIAIFYNTHKGEINWDEELGKLLTEDMIQELIFGKFKFIARDWEELIKYNDYEKKLLLNLKNKISLQISILEKIETTPVQESRQSAGNYENSLLQEVVQTGAALLHTGLPAHYSPKNSGGYQDVISPKRMDYHIGLTANVLGKFRFYPPMDVLKQNGMNEAVCVEPLVEEVYGDVPVRVAGRFGIGTRTEMKRQKTGQKSVLHKQVIKGGSDEEAYSLVYYASDCGDRLYPVYDGRFSNLIVLQTVVPKSVSEKVFAYIKQNPKFVRLVAQEIILNDTGIPRNAWSNGDEFIRYPLRPPYEKWSGKKGGSKIYIQEQGTDYGFNINFVKVIQ